MALTAAMMLVACTTPDPDPSPQEPTTSMDSASVDANDALALAGDLTLPDNLTVETVVDVGDDRDLEAYLVTASGPAAAALEFCSQVTAPLGRASEDGLSDAELRTSDLAATPEGELSLCSASLTGTSVERRVLVADGDGDATLWLSVFEVPSR